MNDKVIILHGFSREEAATIMMSVKTGVPAARDAAFAMTTQTNLEWKLSDLLEHVSGEHEAMKKAKATRP